MNSKFSNKSEAKYKPQLKSRFHSKENTQVDINGVFPEWTRWCLECSLLKEKFETIKGDGILASCMYPLCDDITRYHILFKLERYVNIWEAQMDWNAVDGYKKPNRLIWNQLSGALDKLNRFVSMSRWKPFAMATFALFADVCHKYNGEQKRRFIRIWEGYHKGKNDEWNAVENGDKFTTVEQILILKRKSFPGMAFLQLIEYAENICLSDSEWSDPMLEDFLKASVDCMIYAHDLWSFDSEYAEHGYDKEKLGKIINVVAVAALAGKGSIDEAVQETSRRLDEHEAHTRTLMFNILKVHATSEAVKRFINRVEFLIGGYHKALAVVDKQNMKKK